VAQFILLFWFLHGRTEENHQNPASFWSERGRYNLRQHGVAAILL